MSALPPPPPSSPPPGPAPAPASKPSVAKPADPPPLMPYDDLFGAAEQAPEAAPNLTFNVASAPLPPPPPTQRPAGTPKAPPVPPVDLPGVVVGDDRPAWTPPAD